MELFEYIGQLITISSIEQDLQKDCKEKHFSNEQVCHECCSLHLIKKGKVCGKQRYLCKDCQKSFGDLTNSVFEFKNSVNEFIDVRQKQYRTRLPIFD